MKKLEINKEDLKYNLNVITEKINKNCKDNKNPQIIAVVKANGMGLDLVQYSKFLVENDIKILAVANVEEAIVLRENGIDVEILMLSPVMEKESLQILLEKNITLTVSSLKGLKIIEEIAKEKSIEDINVHLKLDTGFGRYGVVYTNIEEILNIFRNCEKVKIKGTYTHFSKTMDKKWTNLQFDRFLETVEKIKRENFNPGILHASSSTAFLKYPTMHLDAIRIGSVVQGRTLLCKKEFKKIGVFKTNIEEIKQLPKGYFVSYNNSYKVKKDTKIAVIPVGYMDGFNKNKLRDDFSLKNNIISVGMEIKKIFKDNSLKAIINGKKYKIIGKLGMYHGIIDITNENDIQVGDEVILDISPLQTNEKIRREYI